MRTIPGYPDPHALETRPVDRVIWNGAVLAAQDVSVKRRMSSGLPAQVAGGGDMMASEGNATVLPFIGPLVEDLCLPTGDVRLPRVGDSIVVEMGLATAGGTPVYAPQLTGRVDSVGASVAGGGLQINVVDRIDLLDRTASLDPLFHLMPPLPGDTARQEIQLYYIWLLDRLARHCGFNAIPPHPEQGTELVYAPLMGTTWPETGTVKWSRPAHEGQEEGATLWTRAPWGLSGFDLDAAYLPAAPASLSERIFVSFLADVRGDGVAPLVDIRWPGGYRLRFQISATSIAVQTYAPGVGNYQTRAALTHSYRGQVLVSFWVYPDGLVRLQANDTVGTGNITIIGDMATADLEHVRAYAYGSDIRMGGLRVGKSGGVFDLHDWEQTALLSFPVPNFWYIFPGLFGEKVLDVIKDWAKSTLGGGWLDEEGRLVLRHHFDMLNGDPDATLHVDHIQDASWNIDWSAVRERVEVEYKAPVGVMRAAPFVQVWEGSNIALERDETHDELIHPPADEVWVGVADDGLRFAWHEAAAEVNSGRHSWVCAITEDTSAGTETQLDRDDASGSLYRVDGRTWRIHLAAPGVPAGQQAHYRMPEAATWLKNVYRGQNTPQIRAHGKFNLESSTQESSLRGPKGTGTLAHPAGHWIQHEDSARTFADTLAGFVTRPLHVYSGMRINPDDRLQIGDKVDLDWGLRADGRPWPLERSLITGMDHSSSNSGRTMSIDVAVLEVRA